MAFKKGDRLGHKKAGGRQLGTPNKKSLAADKILEKLNNKGAKDFDKIWNGLKPKEQMDAILKALPFSKPQMARIENENRTPQEININFIAATPENVKQIDNTIDIPHEELKK